MQEYDQVELLVEKECYTKEGAHKGDIGTIMDPRKIEGSWFVVFQKELYIDENGEWAQNIAEVVVEEEDLRLVWEAHADLSDEYLSFTLNPQIIDNVPDDLYEVLEKRDELDKCYSPVPTPKDKKPKNN